MHPSTKSSTAPVTPHSHAQRWLIAYDIKNPKRLAKVGRYINKEAVRLQYSIYMLAGTRRKMDEVSAELEKLINPKEDDVRIYPMGENTRLWGLGTQFMLDGNILTDALLDKFIQHHEPDLEIDA